MLNSIAKKNPLTNQAHLWPQTTKKQPLGPDFVLSPYSYFLWNIDVTQLLIDIDVGGISSVHQATHSSKG